MNQCTKYDGTGYLLITIHQIVAWQVTKPALLYRVQIQDKPGMHTTINHSVLQNDDDDHHHHCIM